MSKSRVHYVDEPPNMKSGGGVLSYGENSVMEASYNHGH
jgi:hypothetical protein